MPALPQLDSTRVVVAEDIVTSTFARRILAIGRIITGFYFFWAFLDKTFGLEYATPIEDAWIAGGSPIERFMLNHAAGPFVDFFMILKNPFGDSLFMVGLFSIGLALLLGIAQRITMVAGPLLMFLMWLAMFPFAMPAYSPNPIIDYHWLFAALIAAVCATRSGDTWGLGKWWASKVGDSILR